MLKVATFVFFSLYFWLIVLIGYAEQELRSCPCKSNRVVYVREDILELEALSRKFEEDICLYKERICIGSSKEAEISDINVERVPNFATTLDFSNSKIGISGIVTADDGKSYPSVPNLSSSAYHEVPRHLESRVGLFGLY
jgi:hypothetical protein